MQRLLYVAERSEQKPELTTKLGTTRETLQEFRALRHGRIDIQLKRLVVRI